jgi:hypothetical protein
MTHTRDWNAWRHPLAVAVLVLALAGLVGCVMRPASRPVEDAGEPKAAFTSAAPEDPCTAFGCEL